MSADLPDADDAYTRLLIVRQAQLSAVTRFDDVGVLHADWSPATANSDAAIGEAAGDAAFAQANYQAARAVVDAVVPHSLRAFIG